MNQNDGNQGFYPYYDDVTRVKTQQLMCLDIFTQLR
jgi:hypothetical protein